MFVKLFNVKQKQLNWNQFKCIFGTRPCDDKGSEFYFSAFGCNVVYLSDKLSKNWVFECIFGQDYLLVRPLLNLDRLEICCASGTFVRA